MRKQSYPPRHRCLNIVYRSFYNKPPRVPENGESIVDFAFPDSQELETDTPTHHSFLKSKSITSICSMQIEAARIING